MSWGWLPVAILGLLLAAAELRSARRLRQPPNLRRMTADLLGLLVLALLLIPRPSPAPEGTLQPLSVALAVDVSTSMAARDEQPSRLGRAQLILQRWLDQLDGANWSLLPFAGEAVRQVPLTADRAGLQFFVDQLEPGLVTAPGSAPEEAVALAGQSLAEATGERLILLLSDGERTLPVAPPPSANRIPVLVVRLGSEQGAPLPDRHGAPRRNPDGTQVQTRAEVQRLQQIASASGGLLLDADQALAVGPALQRLGLRLPERSAPAPARPWLPALALLLVLLRCWPRLPLRLRPLGASALLLLALACSQRAQVSPEELLEKAWQAEQRGEQVESVRLFTVAAEQLPASRAAAASYNAATLELAAGHPERAIPLLEASLRLQPGDPDSVHNLALALQGTRSGSSPSGPTAGALHRDASSGQLDLQQALLRSTTLQAAALQQSTRPQQERRVEKDW